MYDKILNFVKIYIVITFGQNGTASKSKVAYLSFCNKYLSNGIISGLHCVYIYIYMYIYIFLHRITDK